MMNLTLNPERADQVFIVEQMRLPYIRAQIATARKDAVNQSSVNQDDIRNLTVRLPPVDRQAAFRKAYEKHGELQKLFKPSSLEADAAIKALQASYLT
jgi:type I restriction enzyme S subunit